MKFPEFEGRFRLSYDKSLANINEQEEFNKTTPLMNIFLYNDALKIDDERIKFLIENSNLNITDKFNNSVFFYSCLNYTFDLDFELQNYIYNNTYIDEKKKEHLKTYNRTKYKYLNFLEKKQIFEEKIILENQILNNENTKKENFVNQKKKI